MGADESTKPKWQRGWTWTLLKCGIALLAAVVLATGGFYALLRALLDWLPGWLPGTWTAWLFQWVLKHVWFVGPVVGVAVGAVASAAIVAWDAKRGRLTRLR